MALDLIIPKSYSGGYRGQSEALWLGDSEAVDPEVQVKAPINCWIQWMRFLIGGFRGTGDIMEDLEAQVILQVHCWIQ
jgi:hypothetical protein